MNEDEDEDDVVSEVTVGRNLDDRGGGTGRLASLSICGSQPHFRRSAVLGCIMKKNKKNKRREQIQLAELGLR